MERSLMEAIMSSQGGGGESFLASMKFAILPIAKVFTMCFMGFLMASKYVNILPANGRKLLNGMVGAIILYTYVFQMLAPPQGESFNDTEEQKLPTKLPLSNSTSEKVPLLTKVEPETAKVQSSKQRKLIDQLYHLIEKLKIKQICQPPIIASVLAIAIGVAPVLKKFILTDNAPLFFFTDSCLILGEAMIPCILLALGGNLVDGPGAGSKKLGLRTTAAIIFGRLVLVPPAGLGIVTIADKLGFIPRGDKMFKFVLLLQHSMPTSVLSGAVASLRGCGKESSSVLFWVHIFAVFSMAGWIILYLRILF